jgi:peptidoglycan glycosyltransferase
MADNVRRVALALTLGFIAVALGLGYWQVFRAPGLLADARYNGYRQLAQEKETQRGRILDRNGAVLAESKPIGLGADYQRVYAYPPLAPVVGYHDRVYGDAGIESAAGDYLSGAVGQSLLASLQRRLLHTPTVGDDVVLTIDLEIQKAADAALGDGPGAIVVVEPKTGDILALASHPYYDPNTLSADWAKLRDDPSHPLLNRATQGLYTPGSVFKTVTLAASLDLKEYQPTTKFTCESQVVVEGFPIRCEEYNTGTFDLRHAYAYSCNSCFGQVGLRLGGKDLADFARRFGFESRIPLEIPTSASQIATSDPERRMVGSLLASTGFGQGELLATPLQMALVSAAVSNGGVVPTPHLIREVRGEDGVVVNRTESRAWRTAVRADTASEVVSMMVQGVDDGLASGAKISGVKVGGKTGTAEVGPSADTHAWFIGVAPADTPRFAIAVIRENGGGGGKVATPMARQVLETALRRPR